MAKPEDPTAAVMAAALEHLVAHDHTFGGGPPPFEEYVVQSGLDPFAGASAEQEGFVARQLTGSERAAAEAAIATFGPVRWIDETEGIVDQLDAGPPTAVLGVGTVMIDGDEALAPVSLLCGSLCGYWLTYRLELIDGAWEVVGDTGEIAIS